MSKIAVLKISVAVIVLSGMAVIIGIFGKSMHPNAEARSRSSVRVSLSTLSENSVTEVSFMNFYKVYLIKNNDNVSAYSIPFYEDRHFMPDPTWQRAVVPCNKFEVTLHGFKCVDPDMNDSWRNAFQWGIDGKPVQKTWVPALENAPFKIVGSEVVISPEYR